MPTKKTTAAEPAVPREEIDEWAALHAAAITHLEAIKDNMEWRWNRQSDAWRKSDEGKAFAARQSGIDVQLEQARLYTENPEAKLYAQDLSLQCHSPGCPYEAVLRVYYGFDTSSARWRSVHLTEYWAKMRADAKKVSEKVRVAPCYSPENEEFVRALNAVDAFDNAIHDVLVPIRLAETTAFLRDIQKHRTEEARAKYVQTYWDTVRRIESAESAATENDLLEATRLKVVLQKFENLLNHPPKKPEEAKNLHLVR